MARKIITGEEMMFKKQHYFYDNRYLHRFFKLNVTPLLLQLKVFPNLKEVTESMGAFVAVHNYLINSGHVNRNDDKVDVFVVGDGSTPRTGALFACLTKWNVFSIDPRLRLKDYREIKRLTLYKDKVEDIKMFTPRKYVTALLVCVHSHAPISDCLNMLKYYSYNTLHLINIPCCYKSDIDLKPNVSYTDYGIQSEKQMVEVYININIMGGNYETRN